MNRSPYIVRIGSALTVLFGMSAASVNAKDHYTSNGLEIGKHAEKGNDLGPCVNGRILDLSRGAAVAAGIKKAGEKVKIYHCDR
ncbi:MAG TPA: hypothetical protein VFS88_01935 [Micavibrio sp.]|nr:hypothetical protein [Micavibrio sp.]